MSEKPRRPILHEPVVNPASSTPVSWLRPRSDQSPPRPRLSLGGASSASTKPFCSIHVPASFVRGLVSSPDYFLQRTSSLSDLLDLKTPSVKNATCLGRRSQCGLSVRDHIPNVKLDMPSPRNFSSVSWNWRSVAQKIGGTCTVLQFRFAISGMANPEGPVDAHTSDSSTGYAHGKKVYTEYSVTGIPGDGRCLFRSVAHGACIRSGKPIPNEVLQRKLADELRTSVADEFIKRRAETEWFIEGHFDTYVSQIRKPHVWGGEPELLMASHVLHDSSLFRPLQSLWLAPSLYMHEEAAGGLIAVAEYGQEYGKEDPIQVLYHGCGHYDALQIPGNIDPRSRR